MFDTLRMIVTLRCRCSGDVDFTSPPCRLSRPGKQSYTIIITMITITIIYHHVSPSYHKYHLLYHINSHYLSLTSTHHHHIIIIIIISIIISIIIIIMISIISIIIIIIIIIISIIIGTSWVRVIPPLRGLEREVKCSWCNVTLFTLASVLHGLDDQVNMSDMIDTLNTDCEGTI